MKINKENIDMFDDDAMIVTTLNRDTDDGVTFIRGSGKEVLSMLAQTIKNAADAAGIPGPLLLLFLTELLEKTDNESVVGEA